VTRFSWAVSFLNRSRTQTLLRRDSGYALVNLDCRQPPIQRITLRSNPGTLLLQIRFRRAQASLAARSCNFSQKKDFDEFHPATSFVAQMFPTVQDVEGFVAEFGRESVIHRMQIPRRETWATQVATTVLSASTKEETLNRAWSWARALSDWILARVHLLTPDERVIVIVGWSTLVRPRQGQIFKIGGTLDLLRKLAACEDWKAARKLPQQQIPVSNWEKDVFGRPGPSP
jgi:hypothetical protein